MFQTIDQMSPINIEKLAPTLQVGQVLASLIAFLANSLNKQHLQKVCRQSGTV